MVTGVALIAGAGFAACYHGNTVYYCGLDVGPRSSCNDPQDRHTYEENIASSLNGHWPMCEKIFAWNDESDIWSRRCADRINVRGSWCDSMFNCTDFNENTQYLLKVKVGNDARYYSHTVHGTARF